MTERCKADLHGNCQHVKREDDGSLTIPLGTHFCFGSTVLNKPFSGFVDTNRPVHVAVPDDLVDDLYEMITVSKEPGTDHIMEADLLMNLVPYLVDRDHKVLKHGMSLGRTK